METLLVAVCDITHVQPLSKMHMLQMNPIHIHYPSAMKDILILSSHLKLGFQNGHIRSGFPNKSSVHSSSSTHVTCPLTRSH
jgi:hypothetical protein